MCMLCQEGRGAGLMRAVAHVRRRRIQGCLIRQVMIANWGGTGKGELLGHEGSGRSKASKSRHVLPPPPPSPRPPSQPNTFSSYCFPSSTADG